MKLSKSYEQYKAKNILLIAAGKQDAALYKAEHGVVDKIMSVQIPKPRYSDNEGIFQKSVHGRVVSGSVEIHDDAPVVRDFIHELGSRVKDVSEEFTDIYVFAPANTKNKIVTALPPEWQGKVRLVEEGNYYKKSPAFLFEKIAKADAASFVPQKKDEGKILEKAEQARDVMGG